MSEAGSDAREDSAAATGLWRYWRPSYWPAWALWLWMQITAHMPLGLALALHAALGRLAYRLPSRLRSTVHTNLELSFPDLSRAERSSLAKRHFAALLTAFAETATAWFASERHLDDRFEIRGIEHLEAALAQGRGIIILVGHFTAIEICGCQLKARLPHFACMYSPRSNPLLEEIQRRGRSRCTHERIRSDRVRDMLASLGQNAAIWYAPDQAMLGKSAVLVPFLGAQAMMTTATSKLARLSGAPVVPLFYRRIEGMARYEIEVGSVLEDFPSTDVVADTRRVAALLDEFVLRAPEQYMWGQKKFRGRPGLPDPYRKRAGHGSPARPDTEAAARR